jgi:phosphate transport system substrate-binding protein
MKTILCGLCLYIVSICAASAEELVIAGTGDSQNMLRLIAPAFEKIYPEIKVKIPNSVGSSGGISAVTAGQVSLARTARRVKSSEAADLVEYRFAISPVVFVAHPSAGGVSNVESTQVMDIYAGKITDWMALNGPSNRLYAVNREKGDSSRNVLEKVLPGLSGLDSKAKVFYSTPETVSALNDHQYTFGYLPMSEAAHANLKVLTVDGIQPSMENIITGKYPYVVDYYFVSKGDAKGVAKAFIDFTRSELSQKIISDFGVVPVSH